MTYRGYIDVVRVGQVDQLAERLFFEEGEGAYR
jgi:hypothetical protein